MAEPFPRASPGVPPVAMALRLGAGPAKAAPTRRSVRRIFPAAHVAGKMIRILSGLRRKPGRGFPFLDLSPGDGGRRSPVGCLLLSKYLRSAWPRSGFGGGKLSVLHSQRLPCVKGAGARRATEGSSAETFAERIIPLATSLPDCRVPSGPMQAAGTENASPQCLPLPPFRGRLPGGGGEVSSTSHIQAFPGGKSRRGCAISSGAAGDRR